MSLPTLGSFPATLPPPVQPKAMASAPTGEDWVYEFLWGGERVRALKDEGGVRLLSRDGRNLVNRFPRVAAAVAKVHARRAIIDGEILILENYSPAAVKRLEAVSDDIAQAQVGLLAYDLLAHDEQDLRLTPLLGRRVLLAEAIQCTPIILSPFFKGDCDAALCEAERLGLQGIVAKRAGSGYRPNALITPWVKVMLPPRPTPPPPGRTGAGLLRMLF